MGAAPGAAATAIAQHARRQLLAGLTAGEGQLPGEGKGGEYERGQCSEVPWPAAEELASAKLVAGADPYLAAAPLSAKFSR